MFQVNDNDEMREKFKRRHQASDGRRQQKSVEVIDRHYTEHFSIKMLLTETNEKMKNSQRSFFSAQ